MSPQRARLAMRTELCIGCYACEVACKQEHDLPSGPRLIRVRPTEGTPRPTGAAPASRPGETLGPPWFALDVCRHCDEPACVAACPTGAVSGESSLLVSVDASLCTACGECADACPFDATQFGPEGGTLLLCDLCWSRVTAGQKPACAHHCPADVLALVVPDGVDPVGSSPSRDQTGGPR